MKNPRVIVVIVVLLSLLAGFVGGILAFKFYPQIAATFPEFFTTGDISSSSGDAGIFGPSVVRKEVTSTQEETIIETVKKISPSVVSVVLTQDVPVYEEYWESPNDFFPEFLVPSKRQNGTQTQKVGGGSGFIISEDGLIVTNKHVVSKDDVDYTVVLNNGKQYEAEVLAKDPIQDLAIIKIKKTGLTPLVFGDSDNLELGQSVIAIGYALGELQNTVSVGVISGTNRDIVAEGEAIYGALQTDTAINPGNSGGPLLNLSGEVIGVNTAVAYNAQNIGFAISINKLKRSINEFKTSGEITYPFLGVNYIMVSKDVKKEYNLRVDYGALIIKNDNGVAVVLGSPAKEAGLQENDIILEIDGEELRAENNLLNIITSHNVGDKIKMKILRGKKEKTLKAVLTKREK